MNTGTEYKYRNPFGIAAAMAVAMVGVLLGLPSAAVAQTVVHAQLSATGVNASQRTTLTGSVPLLSRYAKDTGKLSSSETLKSMKLVLKRGSAEKAALQSFLSDVQNPASTNYHKWLTPAEFGARFGASDADIAAISQWLTASGLHVDGISKSRTVITFSGTEAQFESAFRAEMHRYTVNGESRVANSSYISVPAALAPAVVGVATLGNVKFRPTHTSPSVATRTASGLWQKSNSTSTLAKSSGISTKATPQFTMDYGGNKYPMVGPYDFAEIYGVKPLWNNGYTGTGQSIAIVAESNIAKSDVDAFRAAFGLPETKLNVIVLGDDPGLDSTGAEGEAALDVQWAGALAPDATINLLVAESTTTDTGILVAAEYAIDHDLSPIIDVSWGACELGLGDSGNQYFEDLWSQAAAQGISVMVSSGDAGSVACDQNQYYANYGQQVNGIASPEHVTAVGGTDFYGNVEGASKYWNVNNDPTTLQSAKSYLTESTWNNSCVNPLILLNAAGFGLTETTSGDICDYEYSFLNTVGGGGGISLCTSSDQASQSSCTGGHPAPAWQYGFAGIDSSSKRHLPDVSFFAGSGLWGSAYVYCEADAATDTICVNDNGSMTALTAGGTSFGAPAFAGVVALLNQQQGGRQGNINKYLYSLAAKQYADSTLAANCQSGSGGDTSSCIFHDTVTGSISEPCTAGTVVDPSTGAICTAIDNWNWLGATPGYTAVQGYDAATGLGSVNVSNLAANWASAVSANLSTVTTYNIEGATSIPYGTTSSALVNVKAGSGSTSPSGPVALMSVESDGSTLSVSGANLNNGSAAVSFNQLTPGTHQLYANYGGDATFGSSVSSPATFTVTKAETALSVEASAATISAPGSSTLVIKVQTASTALNPTGNAVVTNLTTGNVIGSGAVSAYTDAATGNSWSVLSFKVTGPMLAAGDNVLSVAYAGDANYLQAAAQTITVNYKPVYTVTASSTAMDIALGTSSQATATITIAAAGGKVDPSVLSLACQTASSVSGLSCSFSTPVQNADGTVSSTLTLTAHNPQTNTTTSALHVAPSILKKGASLMMLALGGLFWGGRRHLLRGLRMGLMMLVLVALAVLAACGGSAKSTPVVVNQLSVSASSVSYGSNLTLTSSLSTVANKSTPGGTVLFYDGANLLGSAAVSGGKASLTVNSLSVGTHSLTASYSGDTTFMPSTSAAASVSVTLSTTLNINVSDTAGNLSTLSLPVTIH